MAAHAQVEDKEDKKDNSFLLFKKLCVLARMLSSKSNEVFRGRFFDGMDGMDEMDGTDGMQRVVDTSP